MCPGCLRPAADCVCRDASRTPPASSGDGIVRIHRETKGRKGAGVTLVKGLALSEAELSALAKRLKTRCGVGGAVKAGVIELQGDQREKVRELLEGEGHRVKLAGG
jgi:translation initiation factor 1